MYLKAEEPVIRLSGPILKKTYVRVPRELVYWCLRKRNVPEKLIKLIGVTYESSKTMVTTVYRRTKAFTGLVVR